MFGEIQREYLRAEGKSKLPFVVCTIGVSPAQSATDRPQGFPYHHLLWVTRGEGKFTVGGQSRCLGPGEGFFCCREVPHSYARLSPDFSTCWLTFLGGEGALDYYRAEPAFFFTVTPDLTASFDQLLALCQGNSTLLSRSAAGYAWLTEWLEQVFAPSESPAAMIHQYMETHFGEALTLEEIGAQVRMDRFALCRYYKENQGVTVMEELKRIRIAKAKQFLRYAPCSVEEVGRLCGYMSPSYFGKIFREETGRSPGEYRARHRR